MELAAAQTDTVDSLGVVDHDQCVGVMSES